MLHTQPWPELVLIRLLAIASLLAEDIFACAMTVGQYQVGKAACQPGLRVVLPALRLDTSIEVGTTGPSLCSYSTSSLYAI